MKELSIKEKAQRYKEAIKRAKYLKENTDGVGAKDVSACFEYIFPELKESEDFRIRRELLSFLNERSNNYFIPMSWLTWLKKQGERLENYDEAEKEKAKFVGDGFIECHADFLDFKQGNTYWLEYIGDDKYNVRSDNLLGKTYHITPCQLYTIFKKLTWLEKQDRQKLTLEDAAKLFLEVLSETPYNNTPITEAQIITKQLLTFLSDPKAYNPNAINEQKPADKVEPKFKVGDSIKTTNEEPLTITRITNSGYWSKDLYICSFENSTKWELVEQKSANNIEPKFKVGDWIITNKNHIWYVDETPETTSYLYRLINQYGKVEVAEFEVVDKKARLWTINDAKNGDVIHCWIDGDEFILIYKGVKDGYITTYCHLYQKFKLFAEEPTTMFCRTIQGHFTPATKEQRDTLMKAMADAGYTFNFEKKELKKLGQSEVTKTSDQVQVPAEWSAEDEEYLNFVIATMKTLQVKCTENEIKRHSNSQAAPYYGKVIDWLKSIKDRVQPKQEWSEEDETYMSSALRMIEHCSFNAIGGLSKGAIIDWLVSIKYRHTWKPTKEQMDALDYYANSLCTYCDRQDDLRSLLTVLKKL